MDSGSGRRTTIVSTCCAVVGGIGAVACSLSMTLAAWGIIGTVAAASGSMANMDSGSSGQTASSGRFGSLIRFLVQIGPPLLIISVAAITVSLGLRRRAAVIPAVLAGAVMYAGMYLQSAVPLMYGSIAVGLIVWTLLYVWTQRRQQRLRPDGTEGQAA
jgi:hypothetical protein